MKPLFHPTLVNGPFGDPVLCVEFMFERRVLLFDLGEIRDLPNRKLLRTTHIFVSHTHMDHFVGFDHLLRVCLGREKQLHLFGPPGFITHVEHKLAAYTWNLVHNYASDFTLVVTEVGAEGLGRRAEFHTQQAFRREGEHTLDLRDGVLLDDESFLVRYAVLDHRIPSLAFALEEKRHVNVWKNRLDALGLPVGPWLKALKRAVLGNEPDDTPIPVEGPEGYRTTLPLGELKAQVLRIVAGQKLAYVADAAGHDANGRRIVGLARDADLLFIEAAFLQRDAHLAEDKCHLTARQAGGLAREARARRVVPFHFSARYGHRPESILAEVQTAFGGET